MKARTLIGYALLLPLAGCSSDGPNAQQAQPPGYSDPAPSSSNPTATPTAPSASPSSTSSENPVASDTPLTGNENPPPNGSQTNQPGDPPVTDPSLPPQETECTREFTMPTFQQLQSNPALPDPFTFLDGTRVTTRADWACRRKEISLLAQEFIYGRKPGPPDTLQASFSNGALSVTATVGAQSTTFNVPITLPNGGGGPFPGVFSLGGITPNGVAVINMRAALNQLAASTGSSGRQNPPQGDFYRLYPGFASTGSLMAWAWTASRIIDGLEQATGHNVDTSKLSALGCSRDGKAAATIALFDDRFAMVAAQSPGSGTTSGWRVADSVFTGTGVGNVQRARQIYGEDTWMGAVFQPFTTAVDRLPIDQHTVLALAWPRPLIMMEGTNDYWNCPECSFTTMKYTQMIYQALGTPDRIAFPQPPHQHCGQAGTFAETYYDTFVDRFLRGDESVDTSALFTDTNYTFDANRWQDGDIPTLQ